jgi:hypothetical protein
MADLEKELDLDEIPDTFRENLSEKQQKALLMELNGDQRTDVAEYVGVDRATIWRWDNKDEDYQEAKKALWDSYIFPEMQRTINNVDKAVDTIVQALKNNDPDVAIKVFDRVVGDGGLRDKVIKEQSAEIVAQDPQEENLLRVFRRNKANKRMLKYVSMLIEEKEPDEVIDLIHDELAEVQEADVDVEPNEVDEEGEE